MPRAIGEARNRGKSARRRQDLALSAAFAQERFGPGSAHSPDAAVLSAERRDLLLAALGALGEADRTVIACRHLLGLSEREAAAVIGCRPGTVKSRLSRALQRLRAELDEGGPLGDG